jgi:hypothetical protein
MTDEEITDTLQALGVVSIRTAANCLWIKCVNGHEYRASLKNGEWVYCRSDLREV